MNEELPSSEVKEHFHIFHLVCVLPVVKGVPKINKIRVQHRFYFEASAKKWADEFNKVHAETQDDPEEFRAVYIGTEKIYGRV